MDYGHGKSDMCNDVCIFDVSVSIIMSHHEYGLETETHTIRIKVYTYGMLTNRVGLHRAHTHRCISSVTQKQHCFISLPTEAQKIRHGSWHRSYAFVLFMELQCI